MKVRSDDCCDGDWAISVLLRLLLCLSWLWGLLRRSR